MEVSVIFMLNVNMHQQKSGQGTGSFLPERPILSFLHCRLLAMMQMHFFSLSLSDSRAYPETGTFLTSSPPSTWCSAQNGFLSSWIPSGTMSLWERQSTLTPFFQGCTLLSWIIRQLKTLVILSYILVLTNLPKLL
jgi:hypothetical protein